MAFGDYHVHTSVSHCCKESYGIPEARTKAVLERGLPQVGITDHDVPFKNQFIAKHKDTIQQNNWNDVLLGIEASIRDEKGRIAISRKNLALLDYLMISEHVHIMPAYTLMRKGRKDLEHWWNDGGKRHLVEKWYARHAAMTALAIERYKPDVLAHPWRYPWHKGFLDEATIHAYEPVLNAAAKHGVKLEISRVIMTVVNRDLDGGQAGQLIQEVSTFKPWQGTVAHALLEPVAFFSKFYSTCQDSGITFTMGSDAHNLENVGDFPRLERFFDAIGLKQKNITRVLKEK